jgi:hypothetical protein
MRGLALIRPVTVELQRREEPCYLMSLVTDAKNTTQGQCLAARDE